MHNDARQTYGASQDAARKIVDRIHHEMTLSEAFGSPMKSREYYRARHARKHGQ